MEGVEDSVPPSSSSAPPATQTASVPRMVPSKSQPSPATWTAPTPASSASNSAWRASVINQSRSRTSRSLLAANCLYNPSPAQPWETLCLAP